MRNAWIPTGRPTEVDGHDAYARRLRPHTIAHSVSKRCNQFAVRACPAWHLSSKGRQQARASSSAPLACMPSAGLEDPSSAWDAHSRAHLLSSGSQGTALNCKGDVTRVRAASRSRLRIRLLQSRELVQGSLQLWQKVECLQHHIPTFR
jgi:hypothetical protein